MNEPANLADPFPCAHLIKEIGRGPHGARALSSEDTRTLYAAMLLVAFAAAPLPWLLGSMTAWLLLPWLAAPLAVRLVRVVRTRTDGPALNRALAGTGGLQLIFCLLFSAGILASGGIGS